MDDRGQTKASIERAGEQLFQFAIDRGDMQTILNALPAPGTSQRTAMEYEIQLLRIVAVGWAIAFFLADDRLAEPVGECFWQQVRAFSGTLSTSASLATDATIDYFAVLKQRLDYYLETLNAAGKIAEPAGVIGPAFAEACGDGQDAVACLAGSKMFVHTLHAVREYLDGIVAEQD